VQYVRRVLRPRDDLLTPSGFESFAINRIEQVDIVNTTRTIPLVKPIKRNRDAPPEWFYWVIAVMFTIAAVGILSLIFLAPQSILH
jgi:type IV secretory pathway component VirB8